MGPHWALLARAAAPGRRSRAPLAGEPPCAQWHPLDPEDRRPVGRLAGPLSVIPDLPPSISAVGPLRRAAERPRDPRTGTSRRRLSGSAGSIHRRELRAAKRGGAAVGKTKRGKGSKIMAIADCQGRPVAVHIESATPHEVTLVRATLAERFVRQLPVRLIGDNAYESDRLDAELAHRGVELIAPHRRTRTQRTQDGRPLRRYQRRWKIERLFAWFSELSADRRALRTTRRELSRDATPGLLPHSAARFMRWLLNGAADFALRDFVRVKVRRTRGADGHVDHAVASERQGATLRAQSRPTRRCPARRPRRVRSNSLARE
jgi:hypothetical protein